MPVGCDTVTGITGVTDRREYGCVMDAWRVIILSLFIALGGCAGSGSKPVSLAKNANYCPAGTVLVCTSLFEPGKELRPDRCACAELFGQR
jgi:hypothetical protein